MTFISLITFTTKTYQKSALTTLLLKLICFQLEKQTLCIIYIYEIIRQNGLITTVHKFDMVHFSNTSGVSEIGQFSITRPRILPYGSKFWTNLATLAT
jgi:hypothetical protein